MTELNNRALSYDVFGNKSFTLNKILIRFSRGLMKYSTLIVMLWLTVSLLACSNLQQKESDAENPLFARFVPERLDDFAWENDLVAFRAYGPALRDKNENAGLDCWLKRVNYPIIDKWYDLALNKGKSYHQDHGEGLDNYKVGASLGCGSTALWLNGEGISLETFTSWSDLNIDRKSLSFKLHYEHDIAGDTYREIKHITLVPNTRLFKVVASFFKNGKVVSNLPIVVGMTTHDSKAKINQNKHWLSGWEKLDDSYLGTAVIVKNKIEAVLLDTNKINNPKQDHAALLTRTDNKGQVVYFTGYGWQKAGGIKTESDWMDYLMRFIKSNSYK